MPGTAELGVIFVIVLLLFGPDKLPELARNIGKGVREVRKMSADIQKQFHIDDD